MKFELEPDNRNCPDEVLLEDLLAVAVRLGKTSLTKDEYNVHGRFSAATMQNRFGSWNKALLQSNLSVKKRMGIPHGELLADLKRVADKLGARVLSVEVYSDLGAFSAPTISRAFGSWVKALAAAGLEVSSQWRPKTTDDDLLSNLAAVWEALGRQPKQSDLRLPLSKHSVDTYKRRYGSLRNALQNIVNSATNNVVAQSDAATLSSTTVGTPPPQQKRQSQRDPSWRLRFLVNRRDRFTCRACGRSPANEVGVVLHVDHIVPWSKGGETTLDNLQTLCQKCNLAKSDLPMHEGKHQ